MGFEKSVELLDIVIVTAVGRALPAAASSDRGVPAPAVSIGGLHCAGAEFGQFIWQREIGRDTVLSFYNHSRGGSKLAF